MTNISNDILFEHIYYKPLLGGTVWLYLLWYVYFAVKSANTNGFCYFLISYVWFQLKDNAMELCILKTIKSPVNWKLQQPRCWLQCSAGLVSAKRWLIRNYLSDNHSLVLVYKRRNVLILQIVWYLLLFGVQHMFSTKILCPSLISNYILFQMTSFTMIEEITRYRAALGILIKSM